MIKNLYYESLYDRIKRDLISIEDKKTNTIYKRNIDFLLVADDNMNRINYLIKNHNIVNLILDLQTYFINKSIKLNFKKWK